MVGKTFQILRYASDCGRLYRNKFIAMGLVPGVSLKVLRVAPLGDPVELYVQGYFLALRREELGLLELTEKVVACHE